MKTWPLMTIRKCRFNTDLKAWSCRGINMFLFLQFGMFKLEELTESIHGRKIINLCESECIKCFIMLHWFFLFPSSLSIFFFFVVPFGASLQFYKASCKNMRHKKVLFSLSILFYCSSATPNRWTLYTYKSHSNSV